MTIPPEFDDLAEAVRADLPVLIFGTDAGVARRAARAAHATLSWPDDREARWIAAGRDAWIVPPRDADRRPFRGPWRGSSFGTYCGTRARVHDVRCRESACVCGYDALHFRGGHSMRLAGELDHARFGTIFLENVADLSLETIRAISTRLKAWPAAAGKPRLVVSEGRCLCAAGCGAKVSCECATRAYDSHTARLRAFCDLLEIAVRVTLPNDFRIEA